MATEDWHGVADAAMDVREIEKELATLKTIWSIFQELGDEPRA